MGVIKRQGIKNTIITYIGIIIGAINIIFIQPKLLTPEELGLTRLLYDFSYIIGLAIPLGLPNIIVKYFPLFKDRSTRHNGFAGFVIFVFMLGFIISSILLLAFKPVIVSHYEKEAELFVAYFKFIIPFTFIVSAITVTTAYCQALFKSTIPSFLNDICVRLGTIVITILYFNKIISLDYYVYCFIGIYLVELLALGIYILWVDTISILPARNAFKTHTPKKMLQFGVLLCIASFASIALRKIDGVFLGTYSLSMVGIYTTAVFIASFIEVPLGALERISHTKIADNFAKNNLAEIEKIYTDSVKYLLIIGGLMFIGINTCTKYVYEFLPPSYSQSLHVVFIVSLGSLINVSTGVNSAIMFYSKHYVLGTILLGITLVAVIILNIILIPRFGMEGAAIASAAGAIIFNGIKYLFIYSKFGLQPYNKSSLQLLILIGICTTLGMIGPSLFKSPVLNMLMSGGVLSFLYIICLYYLNVAPELFSGILNRLRRAK
ncbi:MAG: polysaccharide biosynthesis C-terminal domain-containing protein [Bacteroidetes bacterium]|nr:polysaccharide biosynthesis C-terminal domain-containing protein [Bacteroidota bacterium]